jgi:regulatory protein
LKGTAYQRAVQLLARREHSADELRQKLAQQSHQSSDIDQAIDKLMSSGLQSDHRFAENYIRSRCNRGYGELRIKQELKQKGLSADLIEEGLNVIEVDWFTLASAARCKRFGEQIPVDLKERAKQQRFLQYRGFTHEQINESLNRQNEE